MKKIILILTTFITTTLSAQVAIGKNSVTNSSVSLEFYDGTDNTKALILPWVVNADLSQTESGTVIFDATDKKIKYLKDNTWVDWSVDPTGSVSTQLQDGLTENPNAKVMIGGNPTTDTTPGLLVLGDTNKAMVLPKVANPHLTILNPEPGTMVYDTTSKLLAVYNGSVWTFWKD